MNGALAQERMYAGYGKTAAKIGFAHDIYRADSPITPIDPANKIGALPLAVSKTRLFHQPPPYKDGTVLLWADGNQLQLRDFLVGPLGTLYVCDMLPNLPIQAVRCNHRVTIERPGYTTSGSILPDMELIAEGLPVFMQNTRVDIKQPQFGSQTAGTAITHWAAFIPLAQGTLQQHDILTDEDGIRYEIDAPDFTPIGYVCEIRLATI